MMMMSSPVMSSLVFVSLKSLSAMHLFLKGDLNTYYYLPTEIFANSTILSLSLSIFIFASLQIDRHVAQARSFCIFLQLCKLYKCTISTTACDIDFTAINFTGVLLLLHVILILLQ